MSRWYVVYLCGQPDVTEVLMEWSSGAMVVFKHLVPGRPTNLDNIVGQGHTAHAVGAGWGCLDILSLVYHFSLLSPSPWETARYRLKYCLKGPLTPKQSTKQPKFYNALAV